MSLSRRELLLLSFYLIIIVSIGIYLFFFKYGYPHYKQVNEKIITVENALFKIQRILQSKEVVEQEYNAYEQKFSDKKTKQTLSTDILQDIKGKAAVAGLNVINIKPLSLKEAELYSEFDFKLETEGGLKNFGQFLYNLDASPYIFTLKYTQINAQGRGDSLKIQLLISAVLAKE